MENPRTSGLMWYHATDGRGAKDMVILPRKDRLLCSLATATACNGVLGKKYDLDGSEANQINVFNKGQLTSTLMPTAPRRIENCFVTFIEVLRLTENPCWLKTSPQVEFSPRLRRRHPAL
jgi:glucose-6-phosphate isomerase